MNQIILIVATAASLGSALIGGALFAFSSFVMKALARVPSSEGIAAMQSINMVVINPSFLGSFMGTAVLSVGMVALTVIFGNFPSAIFFLGGAVCYVMGTFFVTMFVNVPLNNKLAAVTATDPSSADVWTHYLARWTMWNHIRTTSAMLAALLYLAGIVDIARTI